MPDHAFEAAVINLSRHNGAVLCSVSTREQSEHRDVKVTGGYRHGTAAAAGERQDHSKPG